MSLEERLKYAEMKARHVNVLRPWYKKWWGILILAILGLALISLISSSLYVFNKMKQIQRGEDAASLEKQRQIYLATINNGTDYSLGAEKPQVTIIEFADFACPYCKQSADGIRKIVETYQDKVKLIYRDYPLHENSLELALAGRCAGEQGKFWEMHDHLFAEQGNLESTGEELKTKLLALASNLKLDSAKFSACFDEQRYISAIRNDFQAAETLGLKGTPTWFINNYPLTGYVPEDTFQKLISGLIK